ncbi:MULTISPECIES: ABC transporter substrate-binding protein [unclassified Mesorhizobium]|uniref:ABC transporter substrate-binding protein n=1 Tax=unclassified Mesorhizobium TaxID=325217 RepID=UPI000FCB4A8D|nr:MULTISPECIES: ABC transporter substrate-binding protein [unclassified Mesorhizobium]RVC47299.1 ABC transporter substrate-binding protein [Mesorhizobium sp. M4A.F.Ca.ET.090.04.2.1]RWD53821.1 MAG: ABC transporter substrate-binding protein [Mesorhizobium sp.]RWJ22620.1 MAG: ABC transporter substrate-binding protein [Mesorhizobium sp.]RWN15578.1 MAG: ABC transporter substrate-binding protein [Mesorhizobium sp.]RWN21071.1 MAG: ABC transporter substrate-binding protein [Mesorhizobium sp.]
MTISRREIIKTGLAAGAAASIPSVLRAQTLAADARTVRMVKPPLNGFDPVFSSNYYVGDHGLAVYDTLFALDSKLMPQPQMVGKWGVSDDKKTYTFELRDDLGWHDDTPVTAADCVASIRRWGQIHPGGKLLMERVKDISKHDNKTFTIVLKEPLGLVIDILADLTTPCLFIMRERDANLSPTERVTANIGSGPFKFNEALAKPGASFTYDRNEHYVPRKEPSDGLAGGKVVKVDRVIWVDIADQQTAVAALQAGEVDFVTGPPADLYSAIEGDLNLELEVLNKSGDVLFLRMNCLQKPFENVKARQAMLHLIDQEAVMQAVVGNPQYFNTITAAFGSGTPYSNDENTGWFKKGGNPEKAKQLFKEAGYAGEKIVITDSTDWSEGHIAAQIVADQLRKIGIKAELAPSDWGGVSERVRNRGPVEDGGWSIHINGESNFDRNNVFNATQTANGEKGFTGWPTSDEYEALRAQWADVEPLEERKALARKMQKLYWDFVGTVLLGRYVSPIARRKTLTGLIGMPALVPMWNMQKA